MDRSNNNKPSFWPSYVDIMTTLFAIMLVLFAVTFSRFKVKQKELEAFKDKYEEIMTIYNAVDNIDPQYFTFDPQYLKHIFKIDVNYQKGKFGLDQLMQDDRASSSYNPVEASSVRQQIIEAGFEIQKTITNLQAQNAKSGAGNNIKYLLVIEGQASADGYHNDDYYNNDVLSYQRALKLHEFWRSHADLDFTNMAGCELVIAGSGEGGVPRAPRSQNGGDDSHNQRFLIHIVPVIGNIHLADSQQTGVSSADYIRP